MILESIQFQRQPDNPTIVVEGVNSTRVRLIWALTESAGETITAVFFKVLKPGDTDPTGTLIASRTARGSFNPNEGFKDRSNYEAKLEYELVIVNAKGVDKYIYILSLTYNKNNVPKVIANSVEIEVKGK